MKKKHSNLLIYSSIGITSIIIFFMSLSPIFAAKEFTWGDVNYKGCGDGNFNCGVTPMTQDETSAVPVSVSSMVRHRGLPSNHDLSSKMPPIDTQGRQGSCTAWASTYYMKSYYEHIKNKDSYDAVVTGGKGSNIYSPAFTYNQINGGRDRGSNLSRAMKLLVNKGAVAWKVWPYNYKDYLTQPTSSQLKKARKRRAKSYERLNTANVNAIKSEIHKGNPILTAVTTFTSFNEQSKSIIDYKGKGRRGGHAIALVGYDDNKVSKHGHKGAFKFINSWGKWWGQKGFGWISYKFYSAHSNAYGGAFVLREKTVNDMKTNFEKIEKKKITPPLNVVASQGNYNNKVSLSWSKVNAAIAYQVDRAMPGKSFFKIGYTTSPKFYDYKVQKNLTYQYRIISIGENGKSNNKDSVIVEGFAKQKTIKKIPAKVLSLKYENTGSRYSPRITLSWQAVTGAKKYQVSRFDNKSYRWKNIAKTRKTKYVDRGPIRNARNSYRVRAINYQGKGPYSRSISVKIGGKNTVPGIVTGVEASQGTYRNKIKVTWKPIVGALGYYVYRYNQNTKKWNSGKKVKRNYYTDRSRYIRGKAKVWYTIIAYNKLGYSAGFSKYRWGYTGSSWAMRAAGKITSPKNLEIRVIRKTARRIVLNWKRVKSAIEYYIFRKKDSDNDYKYIATTKYTSYNEKFPGEDGELFYYAVKAKGDLNESKYSNKVVAYINPNIAMVKHRFIMGKGIENFTGAWEATYWTKDYKPVELLITINSKGEKFVVTYQEGSTRQTIQGTYATGSTVLVTDGFKMSLSSFNKEIAIIEVNSKRISKKNMRLNFVKL